MRVLFVCHRFPFPPKSGAKIRAFHMIRHLGRRHEVTVASLLRNREEAEEAPELKAYCAGYEAAEVRNPVQALRMLARVPTPVPSSMGFFYSADLRRRIRRLLATQPFDLIVVHCSSVAQYVADVKHIPKILDFCDMDSQKWLDYGRYKSFPLSLGYRMEGTKLMREEKRLAGLFDTCTVATRGEWETLEQFGAGARSDWFPNGVDAQYFLPEAGHYDPDQLCFVGRMDYYPNEECMVEFCTRTLPLIRARRPQVRLTIVGADPGPTVRKLGELPGVTVTGSVPDVRSFLRSAALSVAPLNIARGTQNKILEAMAIGVPVVASAIAAGGVDAVPGEHFLVGNNPEEYAQAALRILENPGERERLASTGRSRMLSHHSWESAMEKVDTIVDRTLAQFRPDVGFSRVPGTIENV